MSSVIEDPAIPLMGLSSSRRHSRYHTNNHNSTTDHHHFQHNSLSEHHIQHHQHHHRHRYHQQQQHKESHFPTVGSRLARRKALFFTRKRLCDASLALAVLGLAVMMLETELVVHRVITRSQPASLVLKLTVTATTLGCLATLLWYHVVDVQLFVVNNSMADWRLALTPGRLGAVCLELLVCAVHPAPGEWYTSWYTLDTDSHLTAMEVPVPLDVLLCLPMFLRLYLLLRCVTLHSRLYQDASAQSLGALSRVRFDYRFVFKSLLTLHPARALGVFVLCFCCLASWWLRLCEMYNDAAHARVHGTYLNAMWVVATTFLTVGYGDIVPNSLCGRGVAVVSGMTGAGCTALLVAVLARRLELSSAERHVHDLVLEIQLGKRLKNQAAGVIKQAWRLHRLHRAASGGQEEDEGRGRTLSRQSLKQQSGLQRAIHGMREIRAAQKRLRGSAVPMLDVLRKQTEAASQLSAMAPRLQALEDKVGKLEGTMQLVYHKLCTLADNNNSTLGCRC